MLNLNVVVRALDFSQGRVSCPLLRLEEVGEEGVWKEWKGKRMRGGSRNLDWYFFKVKKKLLDFDKQDVLLNFISHCN